MALWYPEELSGVLVDSIAARRTYEEKYQEPPGRSSEEIAMLLLTQTMFPGAMLPKVDRMSMAASLEVRVPLLDNAVTNFALTLPAGLKFKHSKGKYLLRRLAASKLPRSVLGHRKMGFAIPLHDWLNDAFWDMARDFHAAHGEACRLFQRPVLDRLLLGGRDVIALAAKDRISQTAATARAWQIVLLARWMEKFRVTA